MTVLTCFHCGLPIPRAGEFTVRIDKEDREMCCPGCQAVASAIIDGGLERFYHYRSGTSITPDIDTYDKLIHYDLPEVQADFVSFDDNGVAVVELSISGMTCSACAWLIEHHLHNTEGVAFVSVNVSSHRCRLGWYRGRVKLSQILAAFEAVGYEARPAGDVESERQRRQENRTHLLRLGVAGLGMMQAGMVAIALYAGALQGIEPQWQHLLRWASLIIVTPVVIFSAKPFFSAAIRSLKMKKLVMDVPVALAIGLAYAASIVGTLTNSGEVYFDSVSMFTFFLLLGRYLEMRVRHRNDSDSGKLSRLVPPVATRLLAGYEDIVPVKSLEAGDMVLVNEGQILPCDGEVIEGQSDIIEAILTGEQQPVLRCPGDTVSAGTLNVNHPLTIRVTAVAAKTRLAAILSLVSEAQSVKPRHAALADKLSGWFVGAVLVVSGCVFASWYFIEPARAFWITLSVLVVTCPCALSLATPAALSVATGELRKRGFLIRKPHVLETLGQLDHCIFDKTGTLTMGRMKINRVVPQQGVSPDRILTLAAALERGSSHPIARAFKGLGYPLPAVEHYRNHTGLGITGCIEGIEYGLGKPALIADKFGVKPPSYDDAGTFLVLASGEGVLGVVALDDGLRAGAEATISGLRAIGISVELLSGDREPVVRQLAETLAIDRYQGEASPAAKLARIQQLQTAGHKVVMVGDGINDVPVLSGADVSIAMGDAADITRLHADSLLVSGKLETIPQAILLARKTTVIIRQNLGWALAYNIMAVPLAAMGYVPPWAAAIGMSASSVIVVINGLRLSGSGGH
jgi:P-type Cu2+ transporter